MTAAMDRSALEEHFASHPRILDYYHAAEHLHEVARRPIPLDAKPPVSLPDLVRCCGTARFSRLLAKLRECQPRRASQQKRPHLHPRKGAVTRRGLLERHKITLISRVPCQGWPIGIRHHLVGGEALRQTCQRTEQFWSISGAETILALRSKWLSEERIQTLLLGRDPTATAHKLSRTQRKTS